MKKMLWMCLLLVIPLVGAWTIEDDNVYEHTDKYSIDASPHTKIDEGWVYGNLTNKGVTGDFTFATSTSFTMLQYWNPHQEWVDYEYKCNYDFQYEWNEPDSEANYYVCYNENGTVSEGQFDTGDLGSATVYYDRLEDFNWSNVNKPIGTVSYNGKTWKYVEDITMQSNVTKVIRLWLDVPRLELGEKPQKTKYDIVFFPSSYPVTKLGITQAVDDGKFFHLDPWTVPSSKLLLYHSMNNVNVSGTNVQDESGNNNIGINPSVELFKGVNYEGIFFTGSDDYIEHAPGDFSDSDFSSGGSINVWAKKMRWWDSTTVWAFPGRMAMYWHPNGSIQVYHYTGSDNWITSSSLQNDTHTYQITYTWDNTNCYLYIDGVINNTVSCGNPSLADSRPFCIATQTYSGNNCTTGTVGNATLDEFAIWNTNLTPTDVSYLYDNGRANVHPFEEPPSSGTMILPYNHITTDYYSKDDGGRNAAWINILNFDLYKIPDDVTINNITLMFWSIEEDGPFYTIVADGNTTIHNAPTYGYVNYTYPGADQLWLLKKNLTNEWTINSTGDKDYHHSDWMELNLTTQLKADYDGGRTYGHVFLSYEESWSGTETERYNTTTRNTWGRFGSTMHQHSTEYTNLSARPYLIIEYTDSCTPPANGDWNIYHNCTIEDKNLTVYGNMIIHEGNNVNLTNTNLTINTTSERSNILVTEISTELNILSGSNFSSLHKIFRQNNETNASFLASNKIRLETSHITNILLNQTQGEESFMSSGDSTVTFEADCNDAFTEYWTNFINVSNILIKDTTFVNRNRTFANYPGCIFLISNSHNVSFKNNYFNTTGSRFIIQYGSQSNNSVVDNNNFTVAGQAITVGSGVSNLNITNNQIADTTHQDIIRATDDEGDNYIRIINNTIVASSANQLITLKKKNNVHIINNTLITTGQRVIYTEYSNFTHIIDNYIEGLQYIIQHNVGESYNWTIKDNRLHTTQADCLIFGFFQSRNGTFNNNTQTCSTGTPKYDYHSNLEDITTVNTIIHEPLAPNNIYESWNLTINNSNQTNSTIHIYNISNTSIQTINTNNNGVTNYTVIKANTWYISTRYPQQPYTINTTITSNLYRNTTNVTNFSTIILNLHTTTSCLPTVTTYCLIKNTIEKHAVIKITPTGNLSIINSNVTYTDTLLIEKPGNIWIHENSNLMGEAV